MATAARSCGLKVVGKGMSDELKHGCTPNILAQAHCLDSARGPQGEARVWNGTQAETGSLFLP